jgi:hypothetical protein
MKLSGAVTSLAARTLDRIDPAWFERVDDERLNLASEHMCVLGQAFGDHSGAAIRRLLTVEPELSRYAVFASNSVYRQHWVDEIATRKIRRAP